MNANNQYYSDFTKMVRAVRVTEPVGDEWSEEVY